MEQIVVFPDSTDMDLQSCERIAREAATVFYEDMPESEEALIERAAPADILAVNWAGVSANVLDALTNLQYVVAQSKGVDHIDVAAATARGVRVLNCPTYNVGSVADFTMGLILAVCRKIAEANRDLKTGLWDPTKFEGLSLAGKNIAVISTGAIGQRVAILAKAYGMNVLTANSKTPPHEIDTILAQADVVTLHVPLNNSTRNLIGKEQLQKMKKGAVLVNTSRGGIVDEKALKDALDSDHLFGAALDVFQDEPHGGPLPESVNELVHHPKVLSTPHLAWNTEKSIEELGREVYNAIMSCKAGDPINVVNPRL